MKSRWHLELVKTRKCSFYQNRCESHDSTKVTTNPNTH